MRGSLLGTIKPRRSPERSSGQSEAVRIYESTDGRNAGLQRTMRISASKYERGGLRDAKSGGQ